MIDDFRFGSAYSPRTGRTEPQVTLGRRLTDNVRANVSTGLTEDPSAPLERRVAPQPAAQRPDVLRQHQHRLVGLGR